MLTDAPVAATIAVRDIDKARKFYSEDLGLAIAMEPAPGVLFFNAGAGTMLQVYERPDHEPSAATVASFNVTDIAAVVAALSARGVHFEDYDLPDFKTGPDHIVEGDAKLAWLTDPEGNIIALAQM